MSFHVLRLDYIIISCNTLPLASILQVVNYPMVKFQSHRKTTAPGSQELLDLNRQDRSNSGLLVADCRLTIVK